MAWQRKTLSEHIAISASWFESAVIGGSALVRNSLLSIFARVIGAALNLFESYLWDEVKNLHTVSMDDAHLRQEAADYGIQPKSATYAMGYVTVSGTIGMTIEEGEILQRSDGVGFAIDEDVLMNDSTQKVLVAALEPGVKSNTIAFAALNFITPQIGISSQVIIDENGLFGGEDEEDTESLRQRVSDRKAQPPCGGSMADYVKWAKAQAGVTRVWVRPDWVGPGSIGVLFVFDNRSDIFPTILDAATLQEYLIGQAPVTQKTRTFAVRPTPKPLDLTIAISPDTPALRTSVTDSLKSFIQYAASPGGTIFLSQIRATISTTAGEADNRILNLNNDVSHLSHEMATLGTITWAEYVN